MRPTALAIAALVTVGISSCTKVRAADLDDFSNLDKALYLSMQTLTVVDWAQTRAIAKNPDRFAEANPLVGKHPSVGRVNTFMTGRMVAQHYLATALPEDLRTPVLSGLNVAYTLVALHNNQAGVRGDFGHQDKVKHFGVSAALGAVAGATIENKWVAFGVALAPGVIKELYDMRHSDRHDAEWGDLAADALGAAVGVHVTGLVITPRKVTYSVALNIF